MRKIGKRVLFLIWTVVVLCLGNAGIAGAEEYKEFPVGEDVEVKEDEGFILTVPEPSKLIFYNAHDLYFSGNGISAEITCSSYSDSKRILRVPAGTYKIIADDYRTMKIDRISEDSSTYEQEFNNSFDTANEIFTDILYNGNLNLYDDGKCYDEDYYHFTLPESGSISVDLSQNNYLLYEEDTATRNTKEISSASKYRLKAGSYFLKVYNPDAYRYGYYDDYTLKINYTAEAGGNYEWEKNDTLESANGISLNTAYTGNIENNSDIDYYAVDVTESGELNLVTEILRQSRSSFTFELLSEDKKVLDTVKSTDNPTAFGKSIFVQPGKYYAKVTSGSYGSEDYKLTFQFQPKTRISAITLTSSKTSYEVGNTDHITASIEPENASSKDLTWSTNDSSVIKVDGDGNITCVGEGKAYVIATAKDGSNVKKELLITVTKPAGTPGAQKPDPKADQNPTPDTDSEEDKDISSWNEDDDWEDESDDCTLCYIGKTSGKWNKKFRPYTTEYVLTLKSRVSKVVLEPETSDDNATYTIEGKKWEAVQVKVGRGRKSTVRIKVTAENGDTMTYKITIKRKK